MGSPYYDHFDTSLNSFVDYSKAAPEIGAFTFEDGPFSSISGAGIGNTNESSLALQRTKSEVLPSNVEAMPKSHDILGAFSGHLRMQWPADDMPLGIESSSSTGSTSSIVSQSKQTGSDAPPLGPRRKAEQHMNNTTDSESEVGEADHPAFALSEPLQVDSTSPPVTPQAVGRSLPQVMKMPMPVPLQASPSQESLQRMRHLQLTSNTGPVLPETRMQDQLMMLMPEPWTMSAQPLQQHMEPHMLHHMAVKNNVMLGSSPSSQQTESSMCINPASTQARTRPSSVDGAHMLWAPISLGSTQEDPSQQHGALPLSQSPPAMPAQVHASIRAMHRPPMASPSGVRRTAHQRLPRKAQSTPHIRTMDGDPNRTSTASSSPNKARSSAKSVRRLQSQMRLNTTPGQGDQAKTPTGRLRMRGSMAALREANAMHAAKQSPGPRKPLTLSFVNYGIEDAEELCSAVAPSGSYKVPLRNFKDSDDEGEPQASSPQAPPSEPLTPRSRNSPSALTPDSLSLSMSMPGRHEIKLESGV